APASSTGVTQRLRLCPMLPPRPSFRRHYEKGVNVTRGRARLPAMTSSAGTPAGHGAGGLPRRVGGPPRIDRAAIARAVTEIGLDEVTVKRVADHLGVSVPGLYHHVRGRDDLLRLAAEHSLARLRLPEDRGQHWAVWLREWARYARAAFAE